MKRERMWRGIALLMTVVALVTVAVTLGGAGSSAAPQAQEERAKSDTLHQWTGVIVQTHLDGVPLAIRTECGLWLLRAEDDATAEAVESHVDYSVDVWGYVYSEPRVRMRPTILVEAVYGEGDPSPEMDVPQYHCSPPHPPFVQHQRDIRLVTHGNLGQTLLSVLQRLAGVRLDEIGLDEHLDDFLGLSLRVLDENDLEVEIAAVPGVVLSNYGTALVLDLNGAEEARTFSLDGVHILRAGGGDADGVQADDRVVAVLKNNGLVVLIASRQVTVWPRKGPRLLPAEVHPRHGLSRRGWMEAPFQGGPGTIRDGQSRLIPHTFFSQGQDLLERSRALEGSMAVPRQPFQQW